ncbi:MAG: polysaccharide biosynthesis/export family protein [Muribaculaceae bacterium]
MNINAIRQNLSVFAVTAIALTSCSSHQSPLPYFGDIDQMAASKTAVQSPVTYSPKIQPDDELYIRVSSEIHEATAQFNTYMIPVSTASEGKETATTPQLATYLVDSKGDITMPVLGKIHVADLTTEQLRDKLTETISHDVKDPLVTVRIMNFKVDVAGEVKTPGPQPVTTERFSILDALTAAGDLTEYGERSNVLLIREEDGKRIAHRFNLNSADILSDPYFYLRPNDYVYVEPNAIRQDNSKYNQNNAYKISVISTIVSGCSVIASLVIALTVK